MDSPKRGLIFKHQVKQVLKGQNIVDMDVVYNLVQELLRGKTLMVLNNKQTTFKEQTPDNPEQ
eukprot:2961467-Ditylum_brightwellii.AAC.1